MPQRDSPARHPGQSGSAVGPGPPTASVARGRPPGRGTRSLREVSRMNIPSAPLARSPPWPSGRGPPGGRCLGPSRRPGSCWRAIVCTPTRRSRWGTGGEGRRGSLHSAAAPADVSRRPEHHQGRTLLSPRRDPGPSRIGVASVWDRRAWGDPAAADDDQRDEGPDQPEAPDHDGSDGGDIADRRAGGHVGGGGLGRSRPVDRSLEQPPTIRPSHGRARFPARHRVQAASRSVRMVPTGRTVGLPATELRSARDRAITPEYHRGRSPPVQTAIARLGVTSW